MKRHLLISILFVFISACGGSGGSGNDTVVEVPTSVGNLNISVSGLPEGENASITISGPEGFSQSITNSIVLSGLKIGSYSVTISDVMISGINYQGFDSSLDLSLSANLTLDANITYGALTQSQGVISGFGSVFVNGTRFNTDTSIITTDDTLNGTDSDLDIGMLVSIQGLVSHDGSLAKATVIDYSVRARGPVDNINLLDNKITVLGQVFLIDELTEFKDTDFESLLVGDIVDISAILNTENNLLATLIKKRDAGESTYIVRGEVSSLDTDAHTFMLDNLTINFANAEVKGELVEAVTVKVKADTAPVDNILHAIEVEIETSELAQGQFIALDGIINEFTNTQEFKVNSQAIMLTTDTKIENGTLSDISLNKRVKVFGQLNENQILVANKIRLDKPGIIKVEGQIGAINLNDDSVTVLGITFLTDKHSHFLDKSSAKVKRFSLSDLAIDDRVEIKAFEQESQFIIRQLKRNNPNSDMVKLEGMISNISETSFELQGVLIITTDITKFEGNEDDDITQTEFFALISEGDEVEVKGQFQENGSLLALKVELGDDDSNRVEVSGTIDDGFISSAEFSVNGHAITTNSNTVYEDGSESDLQAGVEVKIKGQQSESGVILATKIEFKLSDDDNKVELKGTIDSFVSATQFSVNNHHITTDDNIEFKHGAIDDLEVGVNIEIEGILLASGTILAKKIEFEEDDEHEIKGTVANFNSITDFMLETHDGTLQAVTTTEQTEYKDGDEGMLENGVMLEVKGRIENNILIANKIEFEEAEKIEYTGIISDFISTTEFKVDGKAVTTNEFTHFKGGTVDDLNNGILVEVKGTLDSNQALVAIKLEFDD
ncbi:DUF5666 domain-containing protein [Pseudoalteromonas denitrificans]|uniref:DUF5666 domain-containing protein n=1 Tax=Pseudoalteromonas denitrificans DSM 6059 TaxID=1123010 RepID=A0A1I1FPC3_9GAMM|nr:DUF5666 domain-containing protein [Pseudoalteromonas denitrificans]SFC00852.1 hypothetical protein SAMN02745724_00704 [Pseudoalteromonas denitrificans DSM 6059]